MFRLLGAIWKPRPNDCCHGVRARGLAYSYVRFPSQFCARYFGPPTSSLALGVKRCACICCMRFLDMALVKVTEIIISMSGSNPL